ncbi:Eaa1 [Klebsiella pneumoniae]|nr:Eaa1 [Klebsiella pneumoniae]
MTSKLTREQLHERARENVKALKLASRQTAFESAHKEILADLQLAEIALAAMDSEPVIVVGDDGGDALSYRRLIQSFEPGTKLYRHAQPAPVVKPVMFIDGDISSEDADKLAKVIREFNEEDERPLAKMARIIRDNPHPTNECDMPKAQPAKGLESAGWQFKSVNGDWLGLIDEHGKNQTVREGCEVREVYAMADGVNERDQVRREHAEWSQATFGNVGPVGPLKHLSKEALEAAEQPGDLSEWADMQFLLWDAQRRAGITDDQITQAMIDKLAVNKQREWPEPKDGEPRLHIKEQQAPVVEREPIAWLNDAYLARGVVDGEAGSEDAGSGYIPVYREAGPQPAPVITFYRDGIEVAAKWIDQQREAYDIEHGWSDPDTGAFEFGNDAQRGYSSTLEELAEGIRALHPNAGNSPTIPEGYVMVPMRLTAENGAKGSLSGEFSETKFVNCPECFGDDECETCDGSGRIEITVPVTWPTIKEIWAKGVEHFAPAPQEVK